MRVQVEYNVPVIAIVDTDTGEVDRVVVSVEEIQLADFPDVNSDDGVTPVADDLADRALAIAESVEWPAWTFGF